MRALLVDDDPAFRRLASMALQEAGVEHASVATSKEAIDYLEKAQACALDLILLDHELPGMSGPELLRLLRKSGHDIPIVLVTVRDGVTDKIEALQEGADDYIVKPFQFRELVARVRAVVRRSRGAQPIRIGSLEIQPKLRRVERAGEVMHLTHREFEILYVLSQAQDRIVSRNELLHRVWRMQIEPGTNFIEVHISKLRAKLRAQPAFRDCVEIRTIRRQGYRLVTSPVEAPPSGAERNGDAHAGTARTPAPRRS